MPLDELTIESEALRGNPLGDPHVRPLWVYTPPGYDGGPAIYVLQGYTGQVDMWRNRTAFRPTIFELLDGEQIDARVVFVDAWTSVGGSQFVDSHGSGRYHSYICDEIVPFVDERYETNGFRGVAGQVERRPGRRGDRDAAARPLLRLREPCGRRPVRGLDPAVLPARGAAASRRVRRVGRALPRGAALVARPARAPARPAHPASVGLLGRVLG